MFLENMLKMAMIEFNSERFYLNLTNIINQENLLKLMNKKFSSILLIRHIIKSKNRAQILQLD